MFFSFLFSALVQLALLLIELLAKAESCLFSLLEILLVALVVLKQL
jgi:uncharacterized membrane protein (DUF441 family)